MSVYRQNAYKKPAQKKAVELWKRSQKAEDSLLMAAWEEATKILPQVISKFEKEADQGMTKTSLTDTLISVLGLNGLLRGEALEKIDKYLIRQMIKILQEEGFKISGSPNLLDVSWYNA